MISNLNDSGKNFPALKHFFDCFYPKELKYKKYFRFTIIKARDHWERWWEKPNKNNWVLKNRFNPKTIIFQNIQEKINTSVYNRLRFGISATFSKGKQVDYVLGEWSVEEKASLQERLDKCTEIIKSFVLSGVNNTMNTFNGK